MDASNLRTASTYINNLLLARGLLRNGTPVDFGQLIVDDEENKENRQKDKKRRNENQTQSVAQVMNLVHDLILRRDRDREHQESIADTLRTLRAEANAHSSAITRLKTQNDELAQRVTTHQSQARTAQAATSAAEASARRLRDELAKMKVMFVQVRQQCDKDVKRRDLQLDKLKTHLTAQQRGTVKTASVVGPSISITHGSRAVREEDAGQAPSLDDAEYSLQQESTDFLTKLSSSLSDENDSLIGLLKSTLTTLHGLLGQPTLHLRPVSQHGALNASSQDDSHAQDNLVNTHEATYDSLSRDVESALSSLSDLLTNPSFAPIEEVHIREDEIRRLRQGWEKMETRWREAVEMMQGWRERMVSGGDTVNLEELKRGLGLGVGLEGPNDHSKADVADTEVIEDQDMTDGEERTEESEPDVANLPDDEDSVLVQDEDLFILHPPAATSQPALNGSSAIVKSPQRPTSNVIPDNEQVLKESTERGSGQMQSNTSLPDSSPAVQADPAHLASNVGIVKQQTDNQASNEENDRDMTVEQKLRFAADEARRVSSSSTTESPPKSIARKQTRSTSAKRKAEDDGQASKPSKTSATSRTATATTNSTASAARNTRARSNGAATSTAQPEKPVKRTRIPAAAATTARARRKRKSTLSPEELEELMGMVRREDSLAAQ